METLSTLEWRYADNQALYFLFAPTRGSQIFLQHLALVTCIPFVGDLTKPGLHASLGQLALLVLAIRRDGDGSGSHLTLYNGALHGTTNGGGFKNSGIVFQIKP